MSIVASTQLQTLYGTLRASYHESDVGECLSLTLGNPAATEPLLVRLHSACLFGEVFGDGACDCGPQLHAALTQIAAEGRGVVVYLFQEGRGIGLKEKIRALSLQETGLTTAEAMDVLGHRPDERTYEHAVVALRDLQVPQQLRLMSNNPAKRQGLADGGFDVIAQVPLRYTLSSQAYTNLHEKVALFGHHIDFSCLAVNERT